MWTVGKLVNAALGVAAVVDALRAVRRVQGRRLKYPPMPCAIKARCPCRSSPVRSTLRALYLPLGKRMRSPFSSRSYSFLDFAAHAPRSSRGRMGKHDVTMGVAPCRCREWRNQRTFLWKQIERNSIPGQAGFCSSLDNSMGSAASISLASWAFPAFS